MIKPIKITDSLPTTDFTFTDEEKTLLLDYFPQGIVFFDLETTGLSALTDEIIEIAGIGLTPNGKLNFFQEFIKPLHLIPAHTTAIHHITNEDVGLARGSAPVLYSFLHFLNNRPLIAHNAKFDIAFLLKGLDTHQMEFPAVEVYDSCKMARKALPHLGKYSLSYLVEHFSLDAKNAHRAMADSVNCAKVAIACMSLLDKKYSPNKVLEGTKVFCINRKIEKMDFRVPAKFSEFIPKLVKQETIEIIYESSSYKGIFRPVKPIGFLMVPKGPVLYAQCLHSNHNKAFLLSKILDFKF
jgi:DNA polymerase-3 subunit epsilon